MTYSLHEIASCVYIGAYINIKLSTKIGRSKCSQLVVIAGCLQCYLGFLGTIQVLHILWVACDKVLKYVEAF